MPNQCSLCNADIYFLPGKDGMPIPVEADSLSAFEKLDLDCGIKVNFNPMKHRNHLEQCNIFHKNIDEPPRSNTELCLFEFQRFTSGSHNRQFVK